MAGCFSPCIRLAARTWSPLCYLKTKEKEKKEQNMVVSWLPVMSGAKALHTTVKSQSFPSKTKSPAAPFGIFKRRGRVGRRGCWFWGGGISGDHKKVLLKRCVQVHLFSLWCGSCRGFDCRVKSIELSSRKFTTQLSDFYPSRHLEVWKFFFGNAIRRSKPMEPKI